MSAKPSRKERGTKDYYLSICHVNIGHRIIFIYNNFGNISNMYILEGGEDERLNQMSNKTNRGPIMRINQF